MACLKEIVVVYGTRPESLKLGVVVHELRQLGVQPTIIATGQHSDLLRGTPAETDLKNSYSLGIRSDGDVKSWLNEAILRIASALPAKNAIVVVQGDTMSAYATALAASDLGLTLAHVEAGLRSHCLTDPDPEERFRTEISTMADLHFAPTPTSAENLFAEGVSGDVFVTGNTVVSALERYASLEHVAAPRNSILVTMHRREWLACGPKHVVASIQALYAAAIDYPDTLFEWPVHPVVTKVMGAFPRRRPANVHAIPPLPYSTLVNHLRHARGVITDSGGLCEEAATLGVPTAVVRNVTDRPEAIEAGIARLFPPNPDGIRAASNWLLDESPTRQPVSCFGGAKSAETVAKILKEHAKKPIL